MNSTLLNSNRAIVLLAAYDSISLYLTLQALDHTISKNEKVIIILNGKHGIRSAYVEDVARNWTESSQNRFVVKPLNYGNDPYQSIKEILDNFEPLNNVKYICKIDDDLIPLKSGWLDSLNYEYEQRHKKDKVGFVTSLINNNAWGFSELLTIFDKREEYRKIMNYESTSGEGLVAVGDVANGVNGTIWQYPYLAKWCHTWTTLNLNSYIDKTKDLPSKIISPQTHYSIGCIFFEKNFWDKIGPINNKTNFDELSIHLYCKSNDLLKIAVMNQPMVHLFYFVQRKANISMIPAFASSFSDFWSDTSFTHYPKFDAETQLMMQLEELSSSNVFQNFSGKRSFFRKVTNYIKINYLTL